MKKVFDGENFEEIVKKSRKKNKKKSIVMTCVSIILSIIFVFTLLIGLVLLNDQRFFKNGQFIEAKVNFMTPNLRTKSYSSAELGVYNGKSVTTIEKNISGYRVGWGTIIGKFNIFKSLGDLDEQNLGASSDPEGKVMSFFNPNSTYKSITKLVRDKALASGDYQKKRLQHGASKVIYPEELFQTIQYPNELKEISKVEDRVVEVGISFDKAYSYNEVSKMIPKTFTKSWYWLSENQQSIKKVTHLYLDQPDDVINPTTTTFGFSDKATLRVSEPMIRNYAKQDRGVYQVFSKLQENYTNAMSEAERTTLTNILKHKKAILLNGIVLTGKSTDFEQLIGKSWVRAASAGASAQIVPYITVKK